MLNINLCTKEKYTLTVRLGGIILSGLGPAIKKIYEG